MAEISLRGYMREIDELIEREKLDEAIAHCRHVLHTYPKHLETYRLLGKAYLEAKRYGDAADIFQRVLSAVPDDFVSHIGMAIVREDEGNLDASIWHMERAFETNPANPAIQQELRRLIGRRDGLEPHKVRLTRGALARMYAHGELYQQAITELRSALQEDPERPDLQVLLADMYWRTGQRSEAVAVSSRVLEKLPNCMEANRVLAASLRGKERIEESAVYHRRLAGLDPYASFVESTETDTRSVEASAVALERLEWKPGQPIPSARAEQPGWAATLGMELQERQAEQASEAPLPPGSGPLPSWLEPGEPPPFLGTEEESLAFEAEAAAEQAVDRPAPSMVGAGQDEEDTELAPAADEIPSWMRDAGWGEATGEAVEQPVSFSEEELGALEGGELPIVPAEDAERELTPAQLPDWIRGIAPSEEELAGQELEAELDEGSAARPPAWLEQAEAEDRFAPEQFGAAPGGAPKEFEWADQPEIDEALPQDEPTPATLEALPQDEPTPPTLEPLAEPEGFPPGEMQPTAPEPVEAEGDSREWPTWIADEPPGATDTIVTWLDSQGKKQAQAEREEVPAWMSEIELPAEPAAEAVIPEEEEPGEQAVDMPPVMPPAEPVEAEVTPSWLAAVAEAAAREERTGEADVPGEREEQWEAEAEAGLEQLAEQPPDWLTELAETEERAAAPETADAVPGEELPWMAAQPPAELSLEQPGEPGPQPPDAWEAELAGEPPEAAEPSMEPEARTDVPEWLHGLAESVRGAEAATVSDWPAEPEELEDMDTTISPGETPDWLRGLAEEGPPTSPSIAPADVPDWLKGLAGPGAETIDAESVGAEGADWLQAADEEPPSAEPVEAPDWLSDRAEQPPAEAEPEPSVPEIEGEAWQTPDWLEAAQLEMDEQPVLSKPAADLESAADLAGADQVDDEQVMDWLENLAARQSEAVGEEPEEETRWLEISFGDTSTEPLMEDRHLPQEPEEGLEWLERLAEQRGLDIDVGPQQPPAEVRGEVPGEPAELESEPEPGGAAEAPEWLQRMASAPTIPIPRPDKQALESPPAEVPAPGDETQKTPVVREQPQIPQERAPIAEHEAEAAPEEPEAEVPDWLSSFAADWTPPPRAVPEQAGVLEPPIERAPEPPAPATEQQPAGPPVEEAPAEPQVSEQAVPAFTQPAPERPVTETPAAGREVLEPSAPEPTPPAAERPTSVPTPPAAEQPAAVPAPPAAEQPARVPAPPAAEQPISEPTPAEAPADDDEESLDRSRQALAAGDIQRAVASYNELVKGGRALESVIEDLQIALDRSPEHAALWQCLGDAYMKDGQVSEAIEAYRRGMEAA